MCNPYHPPLCIRYGALELRGNKLPARLPRYQYHMQTVALFLFSQILASSVRVFIFLFSSAIRLVILMWFYIASELPHYLLHRLGGHFSPLGLVHGLAGFARGLKLAHHGLHLGHILVANIISFPIVL